MWAIDQGGCFKHALYWIENHCISETELGERGRFLFPFLISRVLSETPHVDSAGRWQRGMTVGIRDGVSSAWGATSDRSSSPRKLLGDDCLAAAPPPLQSGNLPSSIHSTHLTVVAQSILVRSTTGRLDLQFVIPVGRGSPLTPSRCSTEGTKGPSFGLNWVGSGSDTTPPELCNYHHHHLPTIPT